MKFLVISILALCISGCCGSSKSLIQPQLNYNIKFGSGGGFTGNTEGYLIDTTGAVQKWTGKTFDTAKFQSLSTLSEEEINKLNAMITDLDLFNIEYRKTGNMTNFIVLSRDSSEHRISWEVFAGNSDLPNNVKLFYNKLNEMINKSK